ncbi:MAG: helix-turn-helix transcriptional regulator [Ruminococcaceae bacterium]|nr:helix-turn-helix transcriptional regulator [Oscillospiraceae bacterium]
MAESNVCKFVPVRITSQSIDTKNFVFEKNMESFSKFKIIAATILYIVVDGTGEFHTQSHIMKLQKGTVFMTFPSLPFKIINDGNLKYMYVTTLGLRMAELSKRAEIQREKPVFYGYDFLIPYWQNALENADESNIDLISESVVTFTFSFLCKSDESEKMSSTLLEIKKYIDDHYFEPKLSLNSLSEKFKYNSKYLSSFFKRHFSVGLCEYINQIRIQHACELMDRGFSSVKEIASMIGFTDASYFTKVFKRQLQITPKQYSLENGRKEN